MEKWNYHEVINKLKQTLQSHSSSSSLVWTTYATKEYGGETFEYYRINHSNLHNSEQPIVILTAGIHGEEQAGPFTVAQYADTLFDYAMQKNIQLVIYPVLNPSGFHRRTRYNAENEHPNNDFLRYQTEDGKWRDEIEEMPRFVTNLQNEAHPSSKFVYKVTNDDDFFNSNEYNGPSVNIAFETRSLAADLLSLPLHRVVGSVDLHQDYFEPLAHIPGSYAYPYTSDAENFSAVYQRITDEIATFTTLIADTYIDSGYETQIDENGNVIGDVNTTGKHKTDMNGNILRYDGCLAHFIFLKGASINSEKYKFQHEMFSVTVETTKSLQLEICDRVNLTWIKGIIDLVANSSRSSISYLLSSP